MVSTGMGAPASDEAVMEILEILADRQARVDQPVVVRKRLLDLGPEATGAVFDLLSGRVSGLGPDANLDAQSKELLYEVMRSWSSREVAAQIDGRVDAESPLGERMAALRILGEVGDASSVPVVTDIVTTFDPKEARPLQVRATVETTLRRILLRDRKAYEGVSDLADSADLHQLPPIITALGDGGAAEGQSTLERLIGRSDELDLLVLDALSKLDPWDPEADLERCAWLVRGYLDHEDPLFRRQAAISLGRLRDSDSLADLIEALADEDRRVQRGALWGLQEITNLRFEASQERWIAWFTEQTLWFDERSSEVARVAREEAPGPAVAALRDLGHRRVFAGDLVEDVAGALRSESPEVAAYACGTLAQLGHPEAFAVLVGALDDERVMVKKAAGRSLQVLTGLNLPPDSAIWTEWAESTKSPSG